MIAFLNDIFKKTKKSSFEKFSPFLSLFADVLLVYYVNVSMIPRMLNREKLVPMMMKINPQIQYLADFQLEEMIRIMQSTMSFSFIIILVFNSIMYLLAAKKINMGIKFLYGYCLSACLLSIFEMIGTAVTDYPFSWMTFGTTLIYFYVWYGMRYFDVKPKKRER